MANTPEYSPLALRVARYLVRLGYREIPVSRNPRYRAYARLTATGTVLIYWVHVTGAIRSSRSLDKPTTPVMDADSVPAWLELQEPAVGIKPTTATPTRAERKRQIV